jgi:glycosyltransferase involved in cell wall biosynthesis
VDTRLFRPLEDRAALARWRREVLGADVPFLSYVGKPTERRNLAALIRAFALLKARQTVPHRLLIVGADLPGDSPFRQVIAELSLEREVVVRGHASHAEMVSVYNATDLLVYPSSYEGFGMPVLEAMSLGIPVIASRRGALPEVVGDAGVLVASEDAESIANALEQMLADDGFAETLGRRGLERSRQFRWDRTAEAIHDAFRQAIEEAIIRDPAAVL